MGISVKTLTLFLLQSFYYGLLTVAATCSMETELPLMFAVLIVIEVERLVKTYHNQCKIRQ